MAEPSAAIRERVQHARAVQQQRFVQSGFYCNAEIPAHAVRAYCRLDEPAMRLLASACSAHAPARIRLHKAPLLGACA